MTTQSATTPINQKRKEANMKRHLPLVLVGAALALAGCATSAPPTVSDAEVIRNAVEASNVRAEAMQQRLTEQAIAGCVEQVVAVVNVTREQAEAGCEVRLLDVADTQPVSSRGSVKP